MPEPPEWASRLAAAVEGQFAEIAGRTPTRGQLCSVTAISPDVVEMIYSDPQGGGLRGMRIDLASVRSAGHRVRDSSLDELAFDLVTTGICEPRPSDEFAPADSDGVRWLSLDRWLDEVT